MQALTSQLTSGVVHPSIGKLPILFTFTWLKRTLISMGSSSVTVRLVVVILVLLVAPLNRTVQAQGSSSPNKTQPAFPVPSNPGQLFYVQRDPNANTVIYALNLKDGQLDKKDPVHVFWIRYAEQNQQKELSYIQRKFAYGLKIEPRANNEYELRFVSYKKLPLYLVKSDRNPSYYVYAMVNQKKIILKRVYLRIEGGTFWVPNVKYIQLEGTNATTGETTVERITV